ncbi:MAG: hypothetical protein ACLQIQ_05425 [Beijerinckiaceae bacterium]
MSDKEVPAEPRWVARPSTAGDGFWCVVDRWDNGGFVGAGFPTEAEAKAQADLLNASEDSVDDSFLDESGDK